MSGLRTCAAPGCDNPLPARRRGRPCIYCSPSCRPSHKTLTRRAISVEVAHPDTSPDGRPPNRVWSVLLRRGSTAVTVADDLGWPSAAALACQLENLLQPTPRRTTSRKSSP